MNRFNTENAERILEYHEEKAVAEAKLNPGAKELLETLRKKNIRIGILTRNKRSNVQAVADKFGLKFDAVVGREEGPVKPDAFGVRQLCRQFAVRPGEAMVVGDYLFDLLCAKAAGAVAVLLKNHRKAEEFARYADFVIEKIGDVVKIIEDRCI